MTLAVAYVGALYEIASDHVFSGGYANIIKPIHTLVWIICLVVFYHLIRSTIHMDVMLLLSNPKNKVFREKKHKTKVFSTACISKMLPLEPQPSTCQTE